MPLPKIPTRSRGRTDSPGRSFPTSGTGYKCSFTDNFNRADGAIGNSWATGGARPLVISSNKAASPDYSGSAAVGYRTPDCTCSGLYFGGTIGNISSSRPVSFILGNTSFIGDGGGAGTGLIITTFLGAVWVLVDQAAQTVGFTTGGTPVAANGQVIRVEVIDRLLTLKINGTASATYLAANPIVKTRVGIATLYSTTSSTIDDFLLGCL